MGKGKGKEKKGKGKMEKRYLEKVGCMYARTPDAQVILYSVQCYALHWTDNSYI